MNKDEVLRIINDFVKQQGSQATAAKKIGISRAYMNDIIRCRRYPGNKVLSAFGIHKTTTYLVKNKHAKGDI